MARDNEQDDRLRAAQKFASALDTGDYAPLPAVLAPDCEYVATMGTFVGPEQIIAAYRKVAAWMSASFDKVSYRNSVRPGAGGDFIVTFVDDVEHSDLRHVYTCEQVLSFDAEGRIRRIVNVELPGQREAADAFLRRVGIER